jgi:hypothetical protein
MAALYIREEASALRLEIEALSGEDTPSLDRRISREIIRLKLRKYVRPVMLAAACLALLLIIPRALDLSRTGMTAPQASSPAAGAAPEEAAAEPYAAIEAPPVGGGEAANRMGSVAESILIAPEDQNDTGTDVAADEEPQGPQENPTTAGPGEAGPDAGYPENEPDAVLGEVVEEAPEPDADQENTPTGGGGKIPDLVFSLPEGYRLVDYSENNGKGVYRILQNEGAEIVLTTEPSAEEPAFPGMEIMTLGDREVGYEYTGDHSRLAFSHGGILYDLTCRGGIEILTGLASAILAG